MRCGAHGLLLRPSRGAPTVDDVRLPRLPREQYLRIAGRALREGRLSWVVRQGVKTALVPVSDLLDRPLAGPLIANLVITYRCNNTCYQCDLPRPWFYRARGLEELDTDGFKRVIDDLAELGAVGINITGGEPTLRPDCFELLAHAKRAGLYVNISTNAYNLVKPGRVEALLATGVRGINISLDGARAETHDRARGAPGGFERVEKVTAEVVAARDGGKPTITYLFVIGTENHAEIPDLLALASARGVDAVGFMPVFDVYRDRAPRSPDELAAMERAVAALREEKRGRYRGLIDNSDEYLSLFGAAWRGDPSPLKCYATYHHVLIDSYGNLFPCALPYHNGGPPLGNIREMPLRQYWTADKYQEKRRELSGCKACYWNCHTELNLLYQRPPTA